MKRLISAIILFTIGLTVAGSPSYASDSIQIFLYNKQVKTDNSPIIKNGSTLVPIRAVAEALDAKVSWDNKNNSVTIRKWSEIITLTVGKNKGLLRRNSNQTESIDLITSPERINNRVYVPLRFITENLGYKVNWKNGAVYIASPLTAETLEVITKGSLVSARELVIQMAYRNIHYKLQPITEKHNNEDYTTTFIFPEGEALRFYVIRGGTISLVEYKDGFLVASWQASIGQGDGLKQFVDRKYTNERGVPQDINKNFLFNSFGIFGEGSHKSSGRLDLDGKITVLGHLSMIGSEISQKVGTIDLKLENEVRMEHIKP